MPLFSPAARSHPRHDLEWKQPAPRRRRATTGVLSTMNRRSFFLSSRSSLLAGLAVAAMLAAPLASRAQVDGSATGSGPVTPSTPAAVDPPGPQGPTPIPLVNPPAGKPAKTKIIKEDKIIKSKDTVKEDKKAKKDNPLAGVNAKLPDKALYDKAEDAVKHGRFDVARLDLQTLLNTYPDSEFQMRAKLAIADSWYREGGTAALTQAEQEYKDFIVFYPNVPEAAEAQMRVGDIYFRQMDRPDRDYAKATHAEEEYRLMLQQFPDSTLAPQATQRLREVQEALATRESDIAAFYGTHANWPATIARYQTVVDTYPLYSHMDDTLIGLGDAYEAQAKFVRSIPNLPEAGRARLEKTYDDEAANAYRKVVLEHSASRGVEEARDRLAAMDLPIPTPSAEQAAASAALENSRANYSLTDRVSLLILHKPDVVQVSKIGTPTLEDPAPTTAPAIVKQIQKDFQTALSPAANSPAPAQPPAAGPAPAPAVAPAPAAAPVAAAPLAFQDVPSADAMAPGTNPAVVTSVPTTSSAPRGGAPNSMGIEIVQPGSTPAPAATPEAVPQAAPAAQPAAVNTYGVKPVGPPDAAVMAPVEKAGPAPDAVNDVVPRNAARGPDGSREGQEPQGSDRQEGRVRQQEKEKGTLQAQPLLAARPGGASGDARYPVGRS